MRYRNLGKNGPPISVVGFGTWAAGGDMWGTIEDADIVAAMRRAFELGVTWYDTADAYGWGHAEELVAEAFEGRRDEVFIATKVGIRKEGFSLKPAHIAKACDASLKRLRTDRIDLYQIHWPGDRNTPLERSWEAMAALRDAGKVRFIGVSNFRLKHLERIEPIRHVDSDQPEYSMLIRDAEDEVIPWCAEHGTGVVTYGSLAYGLLTGKFSSDASFEKTDWRSGSMGIQYYDRLFAKRAFQRHLVAVDRLKDVASRAGIGVAQLAIAWILRTKAVTSAIVGAKRPSQIEETAAAGDIVLDASTLTEIDSIFQMR